MAEAPRVLVVEARFYPEIADELCRGALAALAEAGVRVERIAVPGAFEVPAAIAFALEAGGYDGFVALGCVIRGETSHYDYVCSESARGIATLARESRAAIGFGILTCETRDQARVRAAMVQGNKGAAAARACLAMIALKRRLAG